MRSAYFIQLCLQDVASVLGLLQLLRESAFHLRALSVQDLEGTLLTGELLKSKIHTLSTDDGPQAGSRVTQLSHRISDGGARDYREHS